MGVFTNLMKMMMKDNGIDKPETLQALEDEGIEEADKIAERLGQTEDRTAFVPKVDIPPMPPVNFDLPEGCKIADNGEIIREVREAEDQIVGKIEKKEVEELEEER